MEFEFNDGGRADAGLEPSDNACAVRAIATATNLPYQTVWDGLYGVCKRHDPNHQGTGVTEPPLQEYLASVGWSWQDTGSRLKLSQMPKEGTFVMLLPGHLAVLRDGVYLDTIDKSQNGDVKPWGYFFETK